MFNKSSGYLIRVLHIEILHSGPRRVLSGSNAYEWLTDFKGMSTRVSLFYA